MSLDLESDLEDAGIDALDFSLMDEDERREALEDAGLDTDTYLDADLDSDFDAWSDLQSSGMSIQELKWMDDDERREALVNSGLDPDNYNGLLYDEGSHYSTHRATDEPTSSTAGTYVKSCESNDKPTNTEADFSAPPRETPHLPLKDQSAEKADYPDNNCNIIEKTPPWVKIMAAICILAFFIGFGVHSYKETQQKLELEAQIAAEEIRQAEEAYQLGKQLYAQEQYSEAMDAFGIAKEKGIEYSDSFYEICHAFVLYETNNFSSAIYQIQSLTKKPDIPKELLRDAELLIQKSERAQKEYEKERQRKYLENLAKSVPYIGMSEEYIAKTSLGTPSLIGHNRQVKNGDQLLANLYDYYNRNGEVIYSVRCVEGKITEIWDKRDNPVKPRNTNTTNKSSSSSEKKNKDPYHASSFAHPDDFYEWYYDDFWDYEDAEDYWDKHHNK